MGDLLNKDMLEPLFGISVKRDSLMRKANMLGIGSGLDRLLYSSIKKKFLKQCIRRLFHFNKFYVWGTGFMTYGQGRDNNLFLNNVHFLSVRGELTKKRVENIIKKEIDIPTGDGGLLVDRWIGEKPPIKYRLGVIPHYKEKDSSIIEEILHYYSDSTIIDVSDEPIEVCRKIASCETVLSSSLHGLIVSDSFHIPNKHILLYPFGDKMMGDGFKFADYYSSYGLQDNPIDMRYKNNWPSIIDIHEQYKIDYDVLEKKKDAIFSVFPR